ncbi:HlyD family efflux transporter periplasmic adaptor subunit [Anaerostipes faecalis]|uniref:HlyD family efflux transporter periplasmic adaptor subunit n=1 Tax=Anaerostipes faecalis TaxID=2738446 RepID=UPI003F04939C
MARKREKVRWNIGMIVFLIIFIYVIINVLIFFGKKKLTVYKVTEDRITNTFSLTGIAIRKEVLLKASHKGYITYYVEEGRRIKKNGTVFILDKEGKAQDIFAKQLEAMHDRGTVTDDSEVRQKIVEYQSVYDDNHFSDVYDLKYDLKNVILNISESSMKKVVDAVGEKIGSEEFKTQKSPASGIVTFYSDNFDGKEPDDIRQSDFIQDNYRKIKYNSSEKVKKNNVVGRVSESENWTVVVSLTKSQYDQLKKANRVTVKFMLDQNTTSADINVKKINNQYYGYLKFDDCCIRYINERYLDLDITLDSYKGLKIPNTALVKKEFYQVPNSFLSKGNDGKQEGFSVRTTNDNGEVKVEQKDYKIYKKTEKYCYLDPEEVGENIMLQSMDSDKTFLIEKTKSLYGVYCTNQGYADFRPVELVIRKDNYSIIKENTKNGVDLYDFIVFDSTTIKENQIIY